MSRYYLILIFSILKTNFFNIEHSAIGKKKDPCLDRGTNLFTEIGI
jgi:hypothetical protein